MTYSKNSHMIFNIGMVMIVVAVMSFTIILSQFGNYSSNVSDDLLLPTVATFCIGGILVLMSNSIEWRAKRLAQKSKFLNSTKS